MAGISVMREYISQQYGGSWREKVKKMPDAQVASIYRRMINEMSALKNAPKHKRLRKTEVRGGDQLCLFKGKRNIKIKEEYLSERTDQTAR